MDTIFDVAIVGYGPVGAVLAILLGQRGRRVVVLERQVEPYGLPRAVHYDHEAARILQACGVAEACSKIIETADVYEFRNGAGEPLMRLGRIGDGLSGWPQSSMFSQPDLEAVLYARVDELPSVEVRRGAHITALDDEGDVVVLRGERCERDATPASTSSLRVVGAADPVRARYAVACDGAKSTVRELLGVPMVDRAFFYDWLIVDVVFDEPRVFDPVNMQVCDPARPTTVVSGGPGRRRWEFMALPGESIDELNDEATAWRLLAPWDAQPDNAAPGTSRRIPVPGPLGRGVAARARAARRRRGAPDAAVRGSGDVCRVARRGQPGVEARPRPRRRGSRPAARRLRPRAGAEHAGGDRPRHRDGQADLRRRLRGGCGARRTVPLDVRRQHLGGAAVPGSSPEAWSSPARPPRGSCSCRASWSAPACAAGSTTS